MPSEPSDAQAQDEAQDESQDQDEQSGNGGVVEAPEGEFPADAKGLDGSSVEQILDEREKRLDPDNRAEETEVSNAGREFDGEKGMFTDEPGFDEAEKKFTLDET